jgi:hypothetical protein
MANFTAFVAYILLIPKAFSSEVFTKQVLVLYLILLPIRIVFVVHCRHRKDRKNFDNFIRVHKIFTKVEHTISELLFLLRLVKS